MKRIGLTYDELTAKLLANGWGQHASDMSWRAKADDPLSEPAVSIEALQTVCEVHPAFTKDVLNLLLAGHGFDICYSQNGYETAFTLRPAVILVSTNPDVFARPVKLGSP